MWGSYCPRGTTVWLMCCFVLLHTERDGYSVCVSVSELVRTYFHTHCVGLYKQRCHDISGLNNFAIYNMSSMKSNVTSK